jgi:hypothetical protein
MTSRPPRPVRLRFDDERRCWQASVNAAPWSDLPEAVSSIQSQEFIMGFFLGRVPAFAISDVEFVPYGETWAEEASLRDRHEGPRRMHTGEGGAL